MITLLIIVMRPLLGVSSGLLNGLWGWGDNSRRVV